MLQMLNEPITSYDVAEALKNMEGVFLVERAGQKSLVTSAAGHSIVSWVPVGEVTQVTTTGNPPYTITPITQQMQAAFKIIGQGGGQGDQGQGGRRSGD